MALPVPPERAVPPPLVTVLRQAASAIEAAGVDYAVAGALRRTCSLTRIFSESSGFDPELAGARLLGRDAVKFCGAEARAALSRMTPALRARLEDQALRQAVLLDEEGDQARTRSLLVAFWDELAHAALA